MNIEGSKFEFRENWVSREETAYSHFTAGEPKNQIQFAFRNHWETWNRIFPELKTVGKVLEVGSGRGTLSMYFAQHGWDTTILDIVPEVLDQAKKQFVEHRFPVNAIVGDCLDMPIPDNSYDVVFSVGLLEHFSNPEQVLREQVRVLAPGGILIGYVVPEPSSECIQHSYEWVNDLLRTLLSGSRAKEKDKSVIYRSGYRAAFYSDILSNLGCKEIGSSGTYPVPMVSWSTEFPFTLLPEKSEELLVAKFKEILQVRKERGFQVPWLCEEEYGQAYLVWARKASSS